LRELQVLEGEEEEDIRIATMDALVEHGPTMEEWDEILSREFDNFKKGEKYDYVKDLRQTFD